MKKVLVNCFEGSVFVRCNQNEKRENVIESARVYFQRKLAKALTGLNNISYITKYNDYLEDFTESEKNQFMDEIDTIDIEGNII